MRIVFVHLVFCEIANINDAFLVPLRRQMIWCRGAALPEILREQPIALALLEQSGLKPNVAVPNLRLNPFDTSQATLLLSLRSFRKT